MRLAEIHEAQERILDLLAQRNYKPDELIDALRQDFEDELVVRQAIWRLLDLAGIELTSERQLTRSRTPA